MASPEILLKLVDTFATHSDHYISNHYNETELRREFLDPFFKALGWDIDNERGYADAYKDVIHEDAIRIGAFTKAPDYCFRIGGTRKFFVEAKRPAVKIKSDPSPAYQLRRYAWSAKLPLSILTDFEEFAVYDTRIKPVKGDSASVARVLYLTYGEYEDKWDEIERIFSREAVLTGSFDNYAETNKKKRGTTEVDTSFLAEIEQWRKLLAKNFALRNFTLSVHDLNYAVQKTIDRIIFLRICEDRGTEDYGRLAALLNGTNTWQRLQELFFHADDRYNSGLFHFNNEKNRVDIPDNLTSNLVLDDSVLKKIVKSLYYPDSPYEFSVLPSDILGQVYEQFLGKTIRLTAGHQAKVDDKPKVRKAGGVYYTPTYIVDYIVENTLGRLLNGPNPSKPKPIPISRAAKLKILDPSCGSGSFLIVAYQYFLDWHRDRYVENAEYHSRGKNPKLYQAGGGEWKLTTSERKRILINGIHGVDIDSQAVEVTKLSLLLKVLEDETHQHYQPDFLYKHQRILPDLSQNIHCGNSLIGLDFYEQPKFPELDEETQYRINVFDWNAAFPEIMAEGGFDCVIGNPPYLNIDDVWGNSDPRLKYIKYAFSEIYNDKTDLLFYFLSLSLKLSKSETGMIVSRAFLEAAKADKLRQVITAKVNVREIIDFRDYRVFDKVGIATAIVMLSKVYEGHTTAWHYIKSFSKPNLKDKPSSDFKMFSRNLTELANEPWIFGSTETLALYQKIDDAGVPLGNLTDIGQGMQTGANSVFGKLTSQEISSMSVRPGQYYIRATNSDIQRYKITNRGEYILYLEEVSNFDNLAPKLQEYLRGNSIKLKGRAAYKRGNCQWWKYTWPLHKNLYSRRKILCPFLATSNRFALDPDSSLLGLTDTTVIFEPTYSALDIRYILGLLNSKVLTYRFRGIGKLKGGGIFEYFENSVSKLPIRNIDVSNSADVKMHDEVVSLVERMMALQVRKAKEKNPNKLNHIKTQIDIVERQIDHHVYSLYDLTSDEILFVEQSNSTELQAKH